MKDRSIRISVEVPVIRISVEVPVPDSWPNGKYEADKLQHDRVLETVRISAGQAVEAALSLNPQEPTP